MDQRSICTYHYSIHNYWRHIEVFIIIVALFVVNFIRSLFSEIYFEKNGKCIWMFVYFQQMCVSEYTIFWASKYIKNFCTYFLYYFILFTRSYLLLTITDVNECLLYPDLCRGGGRCVNTDGSFTCVCPAGMELDSAGLVCKGNMSSKVEVTMS